MGSVSCTTHFVEDAPNPWATKTSGERGSISFWYTPQNNCAMMMAEVARIIESNVGTYRFRVGRLTVRGRIIPRSELGNYMAADLLKDGEDFTIQLLPLCCTVL